MKVGATALLLALALGLLAAPLPAEAQKVEKVYRIGYLWPALSSHPVFVRRQEAFLQGLHELGYVEGQNVVIEYRWAEGREDRLPELANELVRLKVDVIVAVAASAIRAAQQATTTIPIVMPIVGDAVKGGFVASLARPGGNITGLSLVLPELSGKRLQLLKDTFPHVARVAVLWNAAQPHKALDLRETQAAARALGLTLQSLEVRGPNGFETAFEAAIRGGAEALLTLDDPLTSQHRKRIAGLAAKYRLPAMYGVTAFAEVGGLMTYGPNFNSMYRRAAHYVDKILKGAKPADLPVEQPREFELVINLKTAKALGLTIPPSVLVRADRVIE